MYLKFLEKYPSPQALANTATRELQTLLRPLGMEHKRANLLKKLGAELAEKHNGKIPSQPEKLLELPGVGRYAANAVLCFAYGQDVAIVDTNVVRVAVRFFGFKSSRARPKDDPSLWSFVESIIPPGRGKEFNLAILDFGSMVCTARSPRCRECVVRDLCQHCRFKLGTQE